MRRFRHKKRGSIYKMLGRAKMQIGEPICNENQINLLSKNLAERLEAMSFVVYRSVTDGTMWVRPETEFLDGRFEEIHGHDQDQAQPRPVPSLYTGL